MDEHGDTLKRAGAALDSDRAMRIQELKHRVQCATYVVDPPVVALAMIRHSVSQRRWWNPRTSLRTPPARSTTSAGPCSTVPTQVSATPQSGASGATQTHSS